MTLASDAPLRIEVVRDAPTRAAWLAVPYRVFADDPAWIAPLRLMEERRFTPKHPFFEFAEACLFVALRGREPVGRISAQINRRHLAFHGDATGHFGFFECVDDARVAHALLERARDWLAERGMQRMAGPLNFSTNEESGLLVDGFETPPAIMMTHARPWFGALLEGAGLRKEMDLYAYRMDPKTPAPEVLKLAAKTLKSGRVAVRPIAMRRLKDEVELLADIYNDAWAQNWGFVPFARPEIDSLVAELKPVFRSGYGRFVSIDGRPSAVMLGLPDINSVIAPFKGRLLPFNWAPFAFKLARQDFSGARVLLLGIRQEHQRTSLAAGVLALLAKEFLDESRKHNLDWVEFSWVLECNKAMNALARLAAGPPVKTFRVYSTPLEARAAPQ
ncbi:MAG TPA: N-acetyltransferase [Polyangia bacterium]|nr:N-acetyltransferase [Polyangia bacterium]